MTLPAAASRVEPRHARASVGWGARWLGAAAMRSRVAPLVLALLVAAAAAAPLVAPHAPSTTFPSLLNAPPTRIHLRDASGAWHAPFIHPWTRVNQLEQIYEEDRTTRVPLAWFSGGHLVTTADPGRAPLLLAGADGLGRDVFSRLLFGARVSLGLAAVAAAGALLAGVLVGGLAGYAGGAAEDVLMRLTDVVLVLPTIYLVMALRSALPLALSPLVVFALLAALFALVGTPVIARGVRGVVRGEARQDYTLAAVSLGATPWRVLWHHLLPAARGLVFVEGLMLVPSFIVAEATLTYVGFGFPDEVPTWGTMLHDASNIRALADFPWLLAPAVAMFAVVYAINATFHRPRTSLLS